MPNSLLFSLAVAVAGYLGIVVGFLFAALFASKRREDELAVLAHPRHRLHVVVETVDGVGCVIASEDHWLPPLSEPVEARKITLMPRGAA